MSRDNNNTKWRETNSIKRAEIKCRLVGVLKAYTYK